MSNQNNRVLGRIGARELAPEEFEYISGGGAFGTLACSAITATTTGDGDSCLDHDVH